MTKNLPPVLTSYDFLKTFAVVFMIVDHLGYYFFPDDNWWRVFGRLCVPIWFFLIGYARSRDLGPALWVGFGILILANIVAGMSIFPLNILATMIAIRLLIDPVMGRMQAGPQTFWVVSAILFCLILPTNLLMEYGTQGLILAVLGYMIRHNEGERDRINGYLCFVLLTFVLYEYVLFGFSQAQFAVFGGGIVAVLGVLYFFRPQTYPILTERMPQPVAGFFRFAGRRTLEIYVAHLVLFKLLALWLEPERFILLDWKWFSATGL